jgi:hypothetical protein
MKFTKDFDDFLRNEVNLDPTRLTRLQESVDAIENFITGHDGLSVMFLDLIPAGSWAFRTIIRPVQATDGFDADVLLHIVEQNGWLPKDYIEYVFQAFKASGTYKDMVQRHKRCVRIVYAGEFHIDVVPYLERAGQHYITYRLEPPETGTFELSYPEGFTEWMDERERASNGTFVKVVRLLKYLRDYKNTFTCVSVILTTLFGEQLDPIEAIEKPELYQDVPTTLVTLMRKLAGSLPATMPAVIDPGGTGDNFTDRYKDDWNYENFVTMVRAYADKMEAALKSDDPADSIDKWREIFGDSFKSGATKALAVVPTFRSSVPWAGEQFIYSPPFGFTVPRVLPHRVRVTGRVTGLQIGDWRLRNGFRQYDLAKNGNRVARNRSITFRAQTSLQPPYDVYWKVRNGGSEAADAKALRGEITKSDQKFEPTLYAGSHYVECYIVKNGVVVAADHQKVIITLKS